MKFATRIWKEISLGSQPNFRKKKKNFFLINLKKIFFYKLFFWLLLQGRRENKFKTWHHKSESIKKKKKKKRKEKCWVKTDHIVFGWFLCVLRASGLSPLCNRFCHYFSLVGRPEHVYLFISKSSIRFIHMSSTTKPAIAISSNTKDFRPQLQCGCIGCENKWYIR